MTDLDLPSDSTPAVTPSELASRLTWLPPEERALLESTQEEFYKESMEVRWGGREGGREGTAGLGRGHPRLLATLICGNVSALRGRTDV
jgi:hypothetical protein